MQISHLLRHRKHPFSSVKILLVKMHYNMQNWSDWLSIRCRVSQILSNKLIFPMFPLAVKIPVLSIFHINVRLSTHRFWDVIPHQIMYSNSSMMSYLTRNKNALPIFMCRLPSPNTKDAIAHAFWNLGTWIFLVELENMVYIGSKQPDRYLQALYMSETRKKMALSIATLLWFPSLAAPLKTCSPKPLRMVAP